MAPTMLVAGAALVVFGVLLWLGSSGAHLVAGLFLIAGAVGVAIVQDKRRPAPVAAPAQ